MKKLFLILISLMLAFTSAACADTLFPSLAPAVQDPPADAAPSYGKYANVAPDSEEPYAEGGTVVTYSGVSENAYEDFGNYLSEFGFELLDSNVDGRTVEMIVANGRFSIGVAYNADTRELKTIYEEGVEYEKMDYFQGYTRIALGDTVRVKGLGEFTVSEFHLNNYSLRRAQHYYKGHVLGELDRTSVALVFDYLNTTNDTKYYKGDAVKSSYGYYFHGSGDRNDLADITLYYINDNGVYAFESVCYGYLKEQLLIDDEEIDSIPKMESSVRCASFEVPESVLNAGDGMLAVGMEFHDSGEKAVLILRENGIKIGDWE